MFSHAGIDWHLCVLHPRVDVAIARDAGRGYGSVGAVQVAALHSKFTGRVIPAECFLDTSAEPPEVTVERVLKKLANRPLQPTRRTTPRG